MDIKVGARDSLSHVVTEKDILAIAETTGDTNPLHLDESFAAASRFGRRIAHGILPAGLISAVLGTKLPGAGTIYLSQKLDYLKPVFIGDILTAFVEIVSVREDKPIITLATWVENQAGVKVLNGEAIVLSPHTHGV